MNTQELSRSITNKLVAMLARKHDHYVGAYWEEIVQLVRVELEASVLQQAPTEPTPIDMDSAGWDQFHRSASNQQFSQAALPQAAPLHDKPGKYPIDRPCSACSDGDYEMKYHDHRPPFRKDKP